VNSVQRIAKNSLVPMAAQLANKLADVIFTAYVLRVLGETGNGRYAFAVVTWLLIKTISDFGLGVLATREVALRPDLAGLWLGAGTTLRLMVLVGLLPAVVALLAGYLTIGGLAGETALAVILLVISIAPGAAGDAATAVFNARERMEMPALVTVLSTGLKIVLAGLALAAGGGVIGLAAVSLVVNTVSGLVLWRLVRPLAPEVRWWPGGTQARQWLVVAWPLLLNSLLINLFFRLDAYILQSSRGEGELGLYDAAYKFINFTLIVPPYLTLALFPSLARQAKHDPAALRRTLRLAIGYLVMLALPVAVATTALADWLIWLLAGPAFLPGSATALRVLIWFLPFSYVNGIVQYALIALDRQRAITSAFAAVVIFNLAANLMLVPTYGYVGAAAVTVASEIVLLGPLLYVTRLGLGRLALGAAVWRPLAAGAVMIATAVLAGGLGPWLAVIMGGAAYLATLVALGAWGADERRLVRALFSRTRPASS
jgi:O-antigen/teichoic acid export membrane protein